MFHDDFHHGVLFTAAEAGPLLGIEPATITKWAERGRFTSAGRRGKALLYRWGDLVEAEFNTRRSGRLPRPRQLSQDSD